MRQRNLVRCLEKREKLHFGGSIRQEIVNTFIMVVSNNNRAIIQSRVRCSTLSLLFDPPLALLRRFRHKSAAGKKGEKKRKSEKEEGAWRRTEGHVYTGKGLWNILAGCKGWLRGVEGRSSKKTTSINLVDTPFPWTQPSSLSHPSRLMSISRSDQYKNTHTL